MRNVEFSNQAIYHVFNRGTDKRDIFLDEGDRQRFVDGIVAFNDVGRCETTSIGRSKTIVPSPNPYVELVAYCLMPNHYHLLVKQVEDAGVTEFMHRLGTGYTKYFNKRYKRTGNLFEGPYKAKRVETTGYLQHITRYIHINPLELDTGWNMGRKAWEDAKQFLRSYRWSSFRHYIGLETLPFVQNNELRKHFPTVESYERFVRGWIANDRSEEDQLAADLELPALPKLSFGF